MIIKTDVFLKESIGGGAHGAARNLPTFPAGIEVVRESTGYTKPSTKTYPSQDKANPMVKKMNIAFFEHSIIKIRKHDTYPQSLFVFCFSEQRFWRNLLTIPSPGYIGFYTNIYPELHRSFTYSAP